MQLGSPGRSVIKNIFIQSMNNQQIQMDLLSEEKTPSGTLQYALARERGQAGQQKMTKTDTNTNIANPWFEKIQYVKGQNRVFILSNPQSGLIQDCRRCDNKFLSEHLNICRAKNEVCRICKKIGHFAKLRKSEMSPRLQHNIQQRQQKSYSGQKKTKEQPIGNKTNITEDEKQLFD